MAATDCANHRDTPRQNQKVTQTGDNGHSAEARDATEWADEVPMPILIVAVLALGAFGIIGGLLAVATMLEKKEKVANNRDAKTLS